MKIGGWAKTRRQFLRAASFSAATFAFHDRLAWCVSNASATPGLDPSAGPRILSLRLLTAAPLEKMRAFYHDLLGWPVLSDRATELTIGGGQTPITFVQAEAGQGEPFYHFAFNIPENKLLSAREWHLKRAPLIETPVYLRDPKFPKDVRHFRNWNAHSLFFWDPAFNIVEYICRHDLPNAAPGKFSVDDIHYASEIGLTVTDQASNAKLLEKDLGLGVYPRSSTRPWAMGDELGLLLCIPKRRVFGENTDTPKTFDVFPTRATIRGERSMNYAIPNYPYEIVVKET